VALTINSGCLRISTLEGNTVVACHDMPNISFASGGDPVRSAVCFRLSRIAEHSPVTRMI